MAPKIELNKELDKLFGHIPEGPARDAARADYSRMQDGIRQFNTDLDAELLAAKTEREAANASKAEAAALEARMTAWHQTLTEWQQKNMREDENPTPVKTTLPKGIITEEELAKRLTAHENQILETGLNLMTTNSKLVIGHYREFNEELDTNKLQLDARKHQRTWEAEYEAQVADRRKTRSEEARAKEIEAARADERAKVTQEILAQSGKAIPYPVGGLGPSTLDGLKKTPGATTDPYSPEAAVAALHQAVFSNR